MKLLNKHKGFVILALLLIVIIGGIAVIVIFNGLKLRDAKRRFQALRTELKSFSSYSIEISEENVEISNDNLYAIHALRYEWLNAIGVGAISSTPIECTLNLGRNGEFIRHSALRANVVVSPKCYFGFSQYLNTEILPAQESMKNLDLQSQMIKIIASALIESSPKEILWVKRERVNGEIDAADDIFTLSYHHRLRIHDIFCTNAFKVSFVGTTHTLRLFINKMESLKNPSFIRDIEINEYFSDRNTAVPSEEYAVFSVILEFVNLSDFKV